MDEPEPMPAFTFSPDGPTTITHPDGTVSVNALPPDDVTATTVTASDVSATATQADDAPSTTFAPGSPDLQPEVPSTVAEPSGGSGMPDPTAAQADTAASNSVVNPDGSITRQLPDGSTQTLARLPGGAMIVTSTTPPGAYSPPAPPDSPRSRGWRRRNR